MNEVDWVMPESRAAFERLMETIPSNISKGSKNGFATLAKLPQEILYIIVVEFRQAFLAGGTSINLEEFASKHDLTMIDARDLNNCLSLFASSIAEYGDIGRDILELSSGKLYESQQTETAKFIYEEFSGQQEELKKTLQRSTATSETLPSLRSVSATIDVRPIFKDKAVVDMVPIILLSIGTDTSQEIFLQLSTADLDLICSEIDRAKEQIIAVRDYLQKGATK